MKLKYAVALMKAGNESILGIFNTKEEADVFGSKTTTLNSEEGPAFGVALLAAVGGGEYANVVVYLQDGNKR